MVFVNLLSLSTEIEVNGTVADSKGYYAIIESMPDPLDYEDEDQLAHPQSLLVGWGDKNGDLPVSERNREPRLHLATVESILGPIIAVPYDADGESAPSEFMFLPERSQWPFVFMKHIKKVLSGKEHD